MAEKFFNEIVRFYLQNSYTQKTVIPFFHYRNQREIMDLSEQKYAQLVDLLYAVTDSFEGWQVFCKELSQALDATSTQILTLDLQNFSLAFTVFDGVRDSAEYYAAELEELKRPVQDDPRWLLALAMNPDEWMQCHKFNMAGTEEFVEAHRQKLATFGARYSAGYKLLHDKDILALLLVLTSETRQPLADADMAFINRLTPHIKRVINLQKNMYRFSVGALVGYSMINKLHQPVVLLSLTGTVLHANTAADRLMQQTEIIKIQNNNLVMPEPYLGEFQKNCQEFELCYRAGNYIAELDKSDTCVKIMHANDETLFVFSSLILPEVSMKSFGTRPLVMLTFYHPDFAPPVDTQLLTTALGLTPAESHISLLLLEGLSPKQIAAENKVSIDTVKKQMKSIFEKTDTHKQSDLVKLLLNFPKRYH